MNVTANGIRMHYALEGPAGAPVVTLSHSLAARLEMWEPQVKALAGRWRVLRYDTRGHGGSDAPAGPYTLDELAEDARALLGALGISTTHWVGLSMGGMIGQTLALEAPELFASLVLCDTTSRVPPEAKPQWEERIHGRHPGNGAAGGADARALVHPAVQGARARGRRAGEGDDPGDEAGRLHRLLPGDRRARLDRPGRRDQAPHPRHRRRGGSGNASCCGAGAPRADQRI